MVDFPVASAAIYRTMVIVSMRMPERTGNCGNLDSANRRLAAKQELASFKTAKKQIALMDQIAREIVKSRAQTQSRWLQIQTAEEAVSAARDSFNRNWGRIENGQGLPIEALQSMQALTNAQREYTRSVADYNVAQFTLHRSLGWPVDAAVDPENPATEADQAS